MKILHTADLHLGQIIYQNYERNDEHRHFFAQLEQWCQNEQPDALLVSGDIFDIQQPSATIKKAFTDYFVKLHRRFPQMHIVITAGNHDSASRINADTAVWKLANVHLIGTPPAADSLDSPDGWQDRFIIKLDSGYIVALPYMTGERKEVIQSILDRVATDNSLGLPVVMMAHQAITGLDPLGHNFDIGTLKKLAPDSMGNGFDYLALGHIHKPQTIGQPEDTMKDDITYQSPVIRYSGSALHVSCDEAYPHTVSLVELDQHHGQVHIRQLRIDELRHFYVLPQDSKASFTSADEALQTMKEFIGKGKRGYIRFRFDQSTDLPSNFNQMVYDTLQPYDEEWRYNPKIIWSGADAAETEQKEQVVFEVAELQQMDDPMVFITRTIDQYPGLDLEDMRQAFEEIELEVARLREEEQEKNAKKTSKKTKASEK